MPKLKRTNGSGYKPPKQSSVNDWVANHYPGDLDDREGLLDAIYRKFGLQGRMLLRAAIRAGRYAQKRRER